MPPRSFRDTIRDDAFTVQKANPAISETFNRMVADIRRDMQPDSAATQQAKTWHDIGVLVWMFFFGKELAEDKALVQGLLNDCGLFEPTLSAGIKPMTEAINAKYVQAISRGTKNAQPQRGNDTHDGMRTTSYCQTAPESSTAQALPLDYSHQIPHDSTISRYDIQQPADEFAALLFPAQAPGERLSYSAARKRMPPEEVTEQAKGFGHLVWPQTKRGEFDDKVREAELWFACPVSGCRCERKETKSMRRHMVENHPHLSDYFVFSINISARMYVMSSGQPGAELLGNLVAASERL